MVSQVIAGKSNALIDVRADDSNLGVVRRERYVVGICHPHLNGNDSALHHSTGSGDIPSRRPSRRQQVDVVLEKRLQIRSRVISNCQADGLEMARDTNFCMQLEILTLAYRPYDCMVQGTEDINGRPLL